MQDSVKYPLEAVDFHRTDEFAPPPGWTKQTWVITDNCCGSNEHTLYLPPSWVAQVDMALLAIKHVYYGDLSCDKPPKYFAKHEDNNSHMIYLDDDIILEQALVEAAPANVSAVGMSLGVKCDYLTAQPVFPYVVWDEISPDADTVYTLTEAVNAFRKRCNLILQGERA